MDVTRMDFTGKVAVVTGGANGIGRAAAEAFARCGARVVVVDSDTESGEATTAGIRGAGGEARFVAADVTRSADVLAYVRASLDAYGAIDCFLNNAGIEGRVATIAEYDEAVFDAVIAVNLKGAFLGLRHVLPVMLRQGGARSSTPPPPPASSGRRACRPTSPPSTQSSGSRRPRRRRPGLRAYGSMRSAPARLRRG